MALKLDLGLYIHWPFCLSKCPYCDFNSHVRDKVDEAKWVEALCKQLEDAFLCTRERRLSTIFFGGGTPSLMRPSSVENILQKVDDFWGITQDVEITMEANPTSVEVSNLSGYAAAGVNRLSLGVQSLDAKALNMLGRKHSVEQAEAALSAAGKLFSRYSFDLIYARPEQTLAAWAEELSKALDLCGGHLSLYQLTIEPGTAFEKMWARGELCTPESDLADDFYELTQQIMESHGMPAYEVSNHAIPGQECQHNMIYWTYQDFIGLGPGAHGRLTLQEEKGKEARYSTAQIKTPEGWLRKIEAGVHGPDQTTKLEQADLIYELMMMGLRVRSGIDFARFKAITGIHFHEVFPSNAKVAVLCAEGFCQQNCRSLSMTSKGLKNVNGILKFLFP